MSSESKSTRMLLDLSQSLAGKSGGQQSEKTDRAPFIAKPPALIKKAVKEFSYLKEFVRRFNAFKAPVDPLELLNAYREAKQPLGILSPYFIEEYSEAICFGLLDRLERLDEALRELHDFRPQDYFTEGHYRIAGAKSAAFRKTPKEQEELAKERLRSEYFTAPRGTKADVKKKITDETGVGNTRLGEFISEMKASSKS